MKGALRLLLLLPVVLSVFGFSFTAYADYCVGVFSQGYHVTTLMHYANNLSSGTADSYVANWNNDHYKAMSNSGSYGNPTVIGQARFVRFRKINGSSTGAYFDARQFEQLVWEWIP